MQSDTLLWSIFYNFAHGFVYNSIQTGLFFKTFLIYIMNFRQLPKLRMVSPRATQYYVTLFRVLIDHNPAVCKQREENNSIFLQRYEISLTSFYLNHIISCFNLGCRDQFFVLSPTLNTAHYHAWSPSSSYVAYQLVYLKSRRISGSVKNVNEPACHKKCNLFSH